jgi:uncharacterized membrane protein (DUF106 family)
MNSISPLGWILIIGLVALIIGINASLFMGAKKQHNADSWISRLQAAGKTARDPFRKENDMLDHLSDKVQELQKNKTEKNNGA